MIYEIGYELNWLSDVGRHERVEAQFLNRDTELGQFAFVGLDHVRVSLSYLLEFSLDTLDSFVLDVLYFVEGASDHP